MRRSAGTLIIFFITAHGLKSMVTKWIEPMALDKPVVCRCIIPYFEFSYLHLSILLKLQFSINLKNQRGSASTHMVTQDFNPGYKTKQ